MQKSSGSRVRIPPSPPVQNRSGHAAGSRFYACYAGESPQQIPLRSHDSNFPLRDFDPLGEGAQQVAAVAAAGKPDAFAGLTCEGGDLVGRDRGAEPFRCLDRALSVDLGLVTGSFQFLDELFQRRVVEVGHTKNF